MLLEIELLKKIIMMIIIIIITLFEDNNNNNNNNNNNKKQTTKTKQNKIKQKKFTENQNCIKSGLSQFLFLQQKM